MTPQHFITYPAPIVSSNTGQRGMSLVELLVGLSIGLLTIIVALSTLMMSRSVSSSVSDVSQLQQQAAYAFRIMGRQLRQTGSLKLNPAVQKVAGQVIDISDPVAFETDYEDFKMLNAIAGVDAPTGKQYKLKTGYRNYEEALYNSVADASLQRNCLGQETSSSLIESRFTFDSSKLQLKCAGDQDATPAALVQNVANFEVRYVYQTDPAPFGNPQLQLVAASAVSDWSKVTGAEVCLVLFGNEPIDMPSGTSYTDCDGVTSIDMSTLSGARTKRAHMVFRSTYQLRSQGLVS